MAPHSSTLAWKIPWTEEPGGLQSMGSQRVGHNWASYFHFPLSCIGEGNGNPLQCSCLENPRDRGACWAAIYGVAQSWTQLKQLSSSSSSSGDIQIPISLTWDRTWSSDSESMESYPLDCQGVPTPCFLWTSNLDNSFHLLVVVTSSGICCVITFCNLPLWIFFLALTNL